MTLFNNMAKKNAPVAEVMNKPTGNARNMAIRQAIHAGFMLFPGVSIGAPLAIAVENQNRRL